MAFSLRHFRKAAPRRSLRASTAFASLNAVCGSSLRSEALLRGSCLLPFLGNGGQVNKMEKEGAEMSKLTGLCGQRYCPRICERVCHCPAGKAREMYLLNLQALRRITKGMEREVRREFTS
jgi:hypothetical protein